MATRHVSRGRKEPLSAIASDKSARNRKVTLLQAQLELTIVHLIAVRSLLTVAIKVLCDQNADVDADVGSVLQFFGIHALSQEIDALRAALGPEASEALKPLL